MDATQARHPTGLCGLEASGWVSDLGFLLELFTGRHRSLKGVHWPSCKLRELSKMQGSRALSSGHRDMAIFVAGIVQQVAGVRTAEAAPLSRFSVSLGLFSLLLCNMEVYSNKMTDLFSVPVHPHNS
jgi:hypothetical protein